MNQPTNYFETLFTAESIRENFLFMKDKNLCKYQLIKQRTCLNIIQQLKSNVCDVMTKIPMSDILDKNNLFEATKRYGGVTIQTDDPETILWVHAIEMLNELLCYSIYRDEDSYIMIEAMKAEDGNKRPTGAKLFSEKIEEETGILLNAWFMNDEGKKIKKFEGVDISKLQLCFYGNKMKVCGCGCGKTALKMKKPASLCGTRYVCDEHQKNDWAKHKVSCETCLKYSNQAKALRAERNLD